MVESLSLYLFVGVGWVAVTTTTGGMKITPAPGVPYWMGCGIAALMWPSIAGQMILCLLRGEKPNASL